MASAAHLRVLVAVLLGLTVLAAPARPAAAATGDIALHRDDGLVADYSCADDTALDTCEGTFADGAALDTTSPDTHVLTVTATDTASRPTSDDADGFRPLTSQGARSHSGCRWGLAEPQRREAWPPGSRADRSAPSEGASTGGPEADA